MRKAKKKPGGEHWLDNKRNIKLLIAASIVVLAATVVADFFYTGHPEFGVDGWFGFYAWYGFLTCVAMVLFAKLLGLFVKRPDDYYHDE